MVGETSSRPNSRDSSPAPKTGGCVVCSIKIGKKLSLMCACCNKPAHTACMEDWKEITTGQDLKNIIGKSGLLWYCHACLPKLPTYFPAPGVREALDEVDKKLENMIKLIAATNTNIKTYSEVVAESKPDPAVSQVSGLAQRLEDRLKQVDKVNAKQIRKTCAILHNISEEFNTHSIVFDSLADLSMHEHTVVEISRLGKKKSTYSKPRPIKIQFTSEVTKIEFMKRYSKYEYREDSFATNDLPPEMRDLEYQLRIKKRELAQANTGSKYQVRNGALYTYDKTAKLWTVVEVELEQVSVTPSASSNTDHSTTKNE